MLKLEPEVVFNHTDLAMSATPTKDVLFMSAAGTTISNLNGGFFSFPVHEVCSIVIKVALQ